MIILVCALITLCVLVYIFYLPGSLYVGQEKTRLVYLRERKEVVYENLRDLQFEFRVGKLSDVDYQQTKKDLQKELAGVMAEVDRIRDKLKLGPPAPAPKAKPVRKEPDPFTCPHCNSHFEKELKFCGECGKPMKAVNV